MNNRQLSQMLLPSGPVLTPQQQAQLSQLSPQQQAQFLAQPFNIQRNFFAQQQQQQQGMQQPGVGGNGRMMYIPTVGQPSIRLAPDGMIRMKQELIPQVPEEVPADIGALLSDAPSGDKESTSVSVA
jgi:hypothetical protein